MGSNRVELRQVGSDFRVKSGRILEHMAEQSLMVEQILAEQALAEQEFADQHVAELELEQTSSRAGLSGQVAEQA